MKRFSASEQARNRYLGKKGAPLIPRPTSDTVVASLTFGFWVNLLTRHYDDSEKHEKLWPDLIPQVFPNARGTEATRRLLYKRFELVKDLRNRVAHYEPIWKIKDSFDASGAIIRHAPSTPRESLLRLNEYIDHILASVQILSQERYDFLSKSGVANYAKALCTEHSLELFLGRTSRATSAVGFSERIVDGLTRGESVSGIYGVSRSHPSNGPLETIILDVKQMSLPSKANK